MKPNTAIVLVEGFEGLGLSWLGACLDAQSPGFNPQHCIHAVYSSSQETEWEEKEFKLHGVQDPPEIHATLFTTTTTKSKIKEGFGVSMWFRTGHLAVT